MRTTAVGMTGNAVSDLDAAFLLALVRSIAQASMVCGIVLVLGWPAGVASGLWEFPGRTSLALIIALPLLLPSFLVAIGLSMLCRGLDGLSATVWTYTCGGVPLVFFATLAAMRTVTRGQVDSARLVGGDTLIFRLSLLATLPVATLAAGLAAVLTLVDVGPGQIFRWHNAASELLLSFAARYDRVGATHQALAIAFVASVFAWPLVWTLAPRLTTSLLSRDTSPLNRTRKSKVAFMLAALAIALVILPVAGLLRPLLDHPWPVARAWSEVTRTAEDSLLYAGLAAGLAVGAGFASAALVQYNRRLQRIVVNAALALFALPPVLIALWLVPLSSRFSVGVALALRCLPITLIFGLRAFGSMPQSWSDAGKVHRVPRRVIILWVVAPWISRWAAPAALLAGLVATAEIGVVMMLHPPGHGTLPLAIFTVMANAPEALVATLCLLYVGLALLFGAILARTMRHL